MSVIEESVSSGKSTSKVDPRSIGDFLVKEREYISRVADAISGVVCRTDRQEQGVTYSILVELEPEIPYDDDGGALDYEVWQRFVRFGTSSGTQAGGYHFRVAAQDQEAIGAYVWREMAAAEARAKAR